MKTNNSSILLQSSPLPSPLGPMLAVADDNALYIVDFIDRPQLKNKLNLLSIKAKSPIISLKNSIINNFAKELTAYFKGSITEFKTPFHLTGTSFQKLTWQALTRIPYGETRAYLEQAQTIEKPEACRAVANANGANRLSIIIPCHRIIRSNGDLGGYSGGIWRKTWLLEHEKKFRAVI